MARLPYPDPSDLTPETQALLEQLPPLNIFKMLSGAGAAFTPFMALVNAYLNDGTLDPELRELVILRVGHVCGSAYELHQHVRVSRVLGMAEDRIQAVGGAVPSPLFTPAENAALAFTDAQIASVKVEGAAFDTAHAHLGDQGMQELILIIGIYMLVCRYLETLEIETEPYAIEGSGLEEIREGIKAHGG